MHDAFAFSSSERLSVGLLTLDKTLNGIYRMRVLPDSSVGIDLKELGGQLPKCLKFCPGIEV